MARQPAPERQRRRYKPDDVRVVFIGESPPAGGTFFYYANAKLHHATRAAFTTAIPALRRENDFLDAFKRLGCYLEDLAHEPVNHLPLRHPARLAARREGIAPLARRIKPLQPRVVVVVMKDIVSDVVEALELAGLGHVPRERLPFPARHYSQYVEQLTEVVRARRRSRVFHPLSPSH